GMHPVGEPHMFTAKLEGDEAPQLSYAIWYLFILKLINFSLPLYFLPHLFTYKNFQAVQQYSQCKLEFPAIRSPRSTDLLKGDEVLISEADLEGYNVGKDTKDLIISSCKIAEPSPMIVKHMTESPIGGDEVLVTEADLEGYETFMIACEDRSLSSNVTAIVPARTRMVMRRLCCLCTSLKSSTGGQPVASRFHEIHAC
ncbi:hypothetical protein B296_00031100, partial [Ensete ventricosum]